MRIIKNLMIGALLPLAVACTGNFDQVAMQGPANDPFLEGLHQGYVKIAKMEFDERDWPDGNKFTGRAALAANGEMVLPEGIFARELPENKVSLLTTARTRLVKALDAGGREKLPLDAAEAQVMFDCWMQELEENKQPEDIAFCQKGFIMAIEKIEYKEPVVIPDAAPVAITTAAAVGAAPEPELAPLPTEMHIYFLFDSAELTGAAPYILSDVVGVFTDMGARHVTLEAHTDSSGTAEYNLILAEKRALRAKKLLTDIGVPESAISIDVKGESKPFVTTEDNVREPQNRRVQLTFRR